MIIIPKKRIEAESKAITTMSGRFILEKLKTDADGKPIEASRIRVAEFDNIITNQGLNRIGTAGDWLSAIQVGSGSATPQATDTGLQAYIAGTTTLQGTAANSQSTPPYYTTRTVTRRFASGAAAGNLSEVGIGWAATGSALFSRALILDGLGNPTTITVLSDEVLDVTYQLRIYPAASDASGSVTIAGVGSISTTTRASNVTNAGQWGIDVVGATGGIAVAPSNFRPSLYSGSIGAITAAPSGTAANATSASNNAYSNNSLERTATASWDLNSGNFTIGAVDCIHSANMGRTQFGLSPSVVKTSANTLTLNFTHAWARRVI